MKALVIAPQPFFSPRGTPFSVYYRTLITSELGVEIDLLTYGQGQDVEIPGVRIIRIPNVPFFGPIKVGPSIPKIFLDGILIVWTLFLLIVHRYEFVHAHEESIFFCLFLRSIFRFKLIYDMHSSLPQQLTNFNFTKSKILIGIFEKLENSSLRASNAVITICPELDIYAKSVVDNHEKLFLIENSILDEVNFKNLDSHSNEPSPSFSMPKDRPTVFYGGTFEHYQGIEILIKAFSMVIKTNKDALLVLVGGRPDQVNHYRQLAKDCGIDGHCKFTGQLSQTHTRSLMKNANIITSPRSEGTNTPLKVYEQLASGIPLVATRILSHTQVLNDDVCILTEPNPESMAEGLNKLLSNQDLRDRVAKNAKIMYEEKYSRSVYKQKLSKLLEGIR